MDGNITPVMPIGGMGDGFGNGGFWIFALLILAFMGGGFGGFGGCNRTSFGCVCACTDTCVRYRFKE